MKKAKVISITSILFALTLSISFANDRSEKKLDSEMRQKMAEMHQKAADCLKSDRPMKECHQEMMQNCPMMGVKGNQSQMCPMCNMEGDGSSMMKKKDKKG